MHQQASPTAPAPSSVQSAPPPALTVDDLARELLGQSTANTLADSPGSPSFRIGKKLLISREGL